MANLFLSELRGTLKEFFRTQGGVELKQLLSTPESPKDGFLRVYPKSDGIVYLLESDGTETPLGLSTDFSFTASGIAGETLVGYSVVYSDVSDSGEFKSASNDQDIAEADVLGILVTSSGCSLNEEIEIQLLGKVYNPSWNWSRGSSLYVGSEPGEIVETEPSGDGLVIKPLGYALSPQEIWFNPQVGWTVVSGNDSVVSDFVVTGTAGESLDQFDSVYLSVGKFYKSSSYSSLTEADAVGIVVEGGGIEQDYTGDILVSVGIVTNPGWSFTSGQTVWVGSSPGDLTQSQPVTGVAKPMGFALSSTELLFDPDTGWTVASGTEEATVSYILNGTAGESLYCYDLVYFSSGQFYRSISTGSSTEADAIGIVTQSGVLSQGSVGEISVGSVVRNPAWMWSPGSALFVGESYGSITDLIPSSGIVKPIGIATAADSILFDPDTGWIIPEDIGSELQGASDRALMTGVGNEWVVSTSGVFTVASGLFTEGIQVGNSSLHIDSTGIRFPDGSTISSFDIDYVSPSELTSISGDIVARIPSLDDYAAESWVTDNYFTKSDFTTSSGDIVRQIPSLDGYATEPWVSSNFIDTTSFTVSSGDIIDQIPDLTDYASQEWVDNNYVSYAMFDMFFGSYRYGAGTFVNGSGIITHNLGDTRHEPVVTITSTSGLSPERVADVGVIYVVRGENQDIVYKTGGTLSDGLGFSWHIR